MLFSKSAGPVRAADLNFSGQSDRRDTNIGGDTVNFPIRHEGLMDEGVTARNRRTRSHFPALRVVLICILQISLGFAGGPSQAETRKPTSSEVAAIRDCATRNRDDLDKAERQCLFNLVATPCIKRLGIRSTDVAMADCYGLEDSIWDALLNENYKRLLEALDTEQAAKARAMQRAWAAYRDTTCGFYDDKIQGSMSSYMHASCAARESARRAVLLDFFERL